jgi:hypothetical protein
MDISVRLASLVLDGWYIVIKANGYAAKNEITHPKQPSVCYPQTSATSNA